MNPLVSVIIPTYNRGYLISDTINSIISQSYFNIEIIIIDDYSSDNTEAVVNDFKKNDKRISYYKRPLSKTKGGNACRNYGFLISKGEYVKWVDSDDILLLDAIEKQVSEILNSGTDLCICNTKIFSEANLISHSTKIWGSIKNEPTPENFILNGFKWHTIAGLWRKNWFKSDLIWDEEILNSQDWLFHFTELSKGIKVSKLNEVLCYARYHNNNMSNANNKKGNYYYNECLARVKALKIAKFYRVDSKKVVKKIRHQLFKYYILIYIKGAPIKGIKLLKYLF